MKRRSYEELGEVELSPEVEAKVEQATAQAEADIEAARVNFRWGLAQVATIKRAAALAGVPYQTYIKQVVFRQALTDIKDFSMTTDQPSKATPAHGDTPHR